MSRLADVLFLLGMCMEVHMAMDYFGPLHDVLRGAACLSIAAVLAYIVADPEW